MNATSLDRSAAYRAETGGYFFLHIAKVGGTGTYRHLPEAYTSRFRGTMGHAEVHRYQDRFGLRLDPQMLSQHSLFVIDHMTVQELLDFGILSYAELRGMETIVYWRDPIERFLSMCNHSNLAPREYYERLVDPARRTGWPKRGGWFKRTGWWKQAGAWLPREREHKILGRKSWYMTTCDILRYNGEMIPSTNVLIQDYDRISRIFAGHGVEVPLTDRKVNSPRKRYTHQHIDSVLRRQLEEFFVEDIQVFKTLSSQQGASEQLGTCPGAGIDRSRAR